MPGYKLRSEDVIHKPRLQRLLIEIVDNPVMAQSLAIKVGTFAAMSGYLKCISLVRSTHGR